MSVRDAFALPLQNTSLCCNYGYGKKEKKSVRYFNKYTC